MNEEVPVDWLIVEGNGRGHRPWYVRLLLDRIHEIAPDAQPKILVPGEATTSADWLTHLGEGAPPHRVMPIERAFAVRLVRELHGWRGPVAIPDGDRWLPLLALASLLPGRKLHGSVLLLRPLGRAPHMRATDRIKALSMKVIRARSPKLRVFSLMASAGSTSEWTDSLLDPVQMRPHDVSPDAWRRRWELPADARVALVIGDVTSRKYVDHLARSMAHVSDGTILVIVGRPDQAVREAVSEAAACKPQRVWLIEGYVPDSDLDTWIAMADAVCVVHRNEGSSGILLKAAAAGTPVLVGGARSVIEAARDLDVRHVVARTGSPSSLAEDLVEATRLPRGRPNRALTQARTAAFANRLLGQ